MAAPLQAWRQLLRLSGNPTLTLSRSAFRARKDDLRNPDWVNVSITLGSTVAIWVLLLKQQNEAITEYERRKAESLSREYEREKAESISSEYERRKAENLHSCP